MEKPIEPVIDYLLSRHKLDFKAFVKMIRKHVDDCVKMWGHQHKIDSKDGLGTTDPEDCILLCLMAKEINPTRVLEVGTWYGTSTIGLAHGCQGDYEIITCDVSNGYNPENPYADHIFYNNIHSSKLEFDDKWIPQLIFVDANIDVLTGKVLQRFIRNGAILVTHDWYPPEIQKIKKEKGARAFEAIDTRNEFFRYLPKASATRGGHKGVGFCCAIMSKDELWT